METVDPSDAFEALMERLLDLGATDLEREIRRLVGQGVVRSTKEQSKAKAAKEVLVQQPLTPEEAYLAAIELVVAAVEPIFMIDAASKEFAGVGVRWAFDSLSFDGEHRDLVGPAEDLVQPLQSVPPCSGEEIRLIRTLVSKIREGADEQNAPVRSHMEPE